jgi:hypothetical protein
MAKMFEITEALAEELGAIRVAIHWLTGSTSGRRD